MSITAQPRKHCFPTIPRCIVGLVAIGVLIVAATKAYSEVRSWDGGPTGTGTEWFDPLNWDTDGAPLPTDELTIGFGMPTTLGEILVTSPGSVTVSGGDVSTNRVVVESAGTFSLMSGSIETTGTFATFSVADGANAFVTGGLLKAIVLIVNPGASAKSPASITVSGGLVDVASSSSVGANGLLLINGGDLIMRSGLGILDSGTVTLAAGTITAPSISNELGGTFSSSPGTTITLNDPESGMRLNEGTLEGAIEGVGGLEKYSTNTLTLTGPNTYTGGTLVQGGRLITNASSLPGTGGVMNNAELEFNQTIDGTFTGAISSAGSTLNQLIKTGGSTLTLTGINTYTGSTLIEAGTLKVVAGDNLPDGTAVILDPGATLDLVDTNVQIGAIEGNGSVLLGPEGITVRQDSSAGADFFGVISGPGSLTKTGTNTFTLHGPNTYSGGTFVQEGTLSVNTDSLPSAGPVTNNARLVFSQTFDGTWSGNVGGSGELIVKGLGSLTLTEANTHTGPTTVDGNLILAGPSSALTATESVEVDSATLTIRDGATINTGWFSTGRSSGRGTIAWESGTFTLTATSASSFFQTTDFLVTIGATGPGTLNIAAGHVAEFEDLVLSDSDDTLSIAPTGMIFVDNLDNSAGGTINLPTNAWITVDLGGQFTTSAGVIDSGRIVGPGGLTKIGPGVFTLNTTPGYTGPTNVNQGTLAMGPGKVLGTQTTVTVKSGAILDLTTDGDELMGALAGGGSIQLGSGNMKVGGNDTSTTFSGVISGPGAVTKQGAGELILTGTNTYAGTTTVQSGTLTISGLPSALTDTESISIGPSGTFVIRAGASVSTKSISNSGTLIWPAGTLNVTGPAGLAIGSGPGLGSTFTLGLDQNLNVSNDTTVQPDGTFTIDGGTFRTRNVVVEPGGTVDWVSGSVGLTTDQTIDATFAAQMDLDQLVTAGKTLIIEGTATFLTPVTIDGGTASVHGISNPSLIDLVAGALSVTVADLGISDDTFGDTFEVGPTAILKVANAVNIAPDGRLILVGGRVDAGAINNNGTLLGEGKINAPLNNASSGELRVRTGERLLATGEANVNSGRIEIIEGDLEFSRPLANASSTGQIVVRGGTMRFGGGLANSGSVGFSFGTSDLFGDVTNDGTIVVSGASNLTVYDDLANEGLFQISAGSSVVFFGEVTGSGSFPGTGTMFLEGDLAPGASPGINNFGGEVAFGPFATLQIEAQATTNTPVPGTDHDQVNIATKVTLNGTLNVAPLGDAGPITDTPLGTEYHVLTYDTRTGMFDAITGTLISSSFALAPLFTDTDANMVDDTLILRALVPGDIDGNLAVNVADLAVFALNFGTTPGLYDEVANTNSWERGDFNADGAINVADLSLLALNFGFSLAADGTVIEATGLSLEAAATLASIDLAISSVPEPAVGMVVMGGIIATIRCRRAKANSA